MASITEPDWPAEHPTLPRLNIELNEPLTEQKTARGKVTRRARPWTARVLISPGSVLQTASPNRLRRWGLDLIAAAAALEERHRLEAANADA